MDVVIWESEQVIVIVIAIADGVYEGRQSKVK